MSFDLPPDVSFTKERFSSGWAYMFRHTQLGELGRILLQGRPDGRTHVTCEVVGDGDDPMTEKRAAIFKPIGLALTRELDKATGGTGHTKEDSWMDSPPRSPKSGKMVATKLMQCERCGASVALLIFAEEATDPGGLEDYARLMYQQVVNHDVPTWVIGPLRGTTMDDRADILKIWPERAPLRQLSPNAFNSMLEPLIENHCS